MIIKVGDLVHVRVEIHDFTLLEGIGVILGKGDPDCDTTENPNRTWVIFCGDDYWHVDEKHFTKITDGRSSNCIKCGKSTSFAKKIRNLSKACRKIRL